MNKKLYEIEIWTTTEEEGSTWQSTLYLSFASDAAKEQYVNQLTSSGYEVEVSEVPSHYKRTYEVTYHKISESGNLLMNTKFTDSDSKKDSLVEKYTHEGYTVEVKTVYMSYASVSI